jgi:hypothetical protein
MLHRHFEKDNNNKNLTKLDDVSRPDNAEGFVSEIFPPEVKEETKPKTRKKANA